MNPALHVEEMFTAADACPDVFDPAGASCRSGRTARLAGNCAAGDVGCAPAAADFACSEMYKNGLFAVVRGCPPLSAVVRGRNGHSARCPPLSAEA